MKILAIVSSYRVKGNTAGVLKIIEGEMHELAARKNEHLVFETVYLGQQDLQLCRGCRVCFEVGEHKCPLSDDLLAIKSKMKAADGLTLTSWLRRVAAPPTMPLGPCKPPSVGVCILSGRPDSKPERVCRALR
jgi:hypothetical protein